jgi:tetratricopeptide (TPR) repeat protein
MHKAVAYSETEKFDLAISFAEKSMEISYQLNDKLSIADLYKIQGIVCRKTKVYDLAEEYFYTSLRINRELDNELNHAETSLELGLLYKEMGDENKSVPYLKDAEKYYKKINSKPNVARISTLLTGGNS